MSRNFLFVLIGALIVCAIGISYLYYQGYQSGVDIQIDEKGIMIDGN